ncbi:sensor histidine kinase [Haliscomenobacter hydrossis]|uniref:histidine kinase n=1 Tax=Haliscomenobacter hydrossis (strain ATCC 27775 / DSM 1100 / LMG 10767 / O) TaxID=760192 RepID=F4L6W1_HALH1|nr:sensor histidine kinase [Haliscomenobacter hydrossis]AEE51916.1 signal transduction histidine kinase [Haliscomenobacter hydrossis DSM 1100]
MWRILLCLCWFIPLDLIHAQVNSNSTLPADRAGTLIGEGQAFLQKRDYVNALKSFDQAKPLLEQQNDEYRLGRLLKQIGDLYSARTYFRQSAEHYRDAITLLRKTGQLELVGDCLESLANINVNFGYSAQAIANYTRALSVKTRFNDTKGMMQCQLMLSKLYFSDKNYELALSHNREAQQLAGNDWATETNTAIQEVVILTFLDKIGEAEQALKKAERLVAKQNNPTNSVKLLSAMANLCLAKKDKACAKLYVDSAKVLLRGSQNPELAVEALSQMAEINKNNEDYEAAFEAMVWMDRYKDVFRTENIERISAEINEAAGAALREKEIESLNLANRLNESQLSKEKQLRLALLRESLLKDSAYANQARFLAALENESKLRDAQLAREKELSQSLSRENALKQQLLNDERRNRNLLFLGLAAMVLLGAVIYLQYRKQHTNNSIIRKQSEELAVLNREIHHRVKNNLQVISSMLDLQSQSLHDANAKAVIKEAILRVQAMAFIHQNLYQDEAVSTVNMNEYIQILSDHLFKTYNINADKIQLHTQIESLKLHTDTAIPLGMVLNELISNALKYAFKNREEGAIWVILKKNSQELLLQVKDDGVGLPQHFQLENTSSFGYEVIQAMAQKLRARLNIESNNGTNVQLLISKFKTSAKP